MYCIVFSGRLLDGYDPQMVRKAVASRLGLDAGQVERLFSGRRVVLKKGVTEESGRLYLSVLRRLGMDAGLARVPRSMDIVQTLATFKVIFWGRILEGYDRSAVMRAAAIRLKARPEQIKRMFNGNKAVLKRGVPSDVGSRYVVELARIGMQIDLEVETAVAAPVAIPEPERIVTPSRSTIPANMRPPGFRRHGDDVYAGLLQTQFELPPTTDYADDVVEAPIIGETSAVVTSATYAAASQGQPVRSATSQAVSAVPGEKAVEYVRCEQCGHRQTPGSRCRICGAEMFRAQSRAPVPIPMDASAFASATTILGNMPPALMRSGVAVSTVPAPVKKVENRRAPLSVPGVQNRKTGLRAHAPALIGLALAILMALLWRLVE